MNQIYISNLQVYPDVENKKINVILEIENELQFQNVDIELIVSKILNEELKKKTLQNKKTQLLRPIKNNLTHIQNVKI